METNNEPAAKIMKSDMNSSVNDQVMSSSNGKEIAAHEMTSKDYYFDSYAHFGKYLHMTF